VIERGECDFVAEIAARLATAAICKMMGIGREHWGLMLAIANETIRRHDQEYARGRSGHEAVYAAQTRAHEFCVGEAQRRRAHPTDDLISALVHGAADGAPLSEEEISFNAIMLVKSR
jgi:cytochrome P450